MTLKNFRLISFDEILQLRWTRASFALCFDADGLLVKLIVSKCPSQRIPEICRQAAPCTEVWILDETCRFVDGLGRYLRDRFIDDHVRHGYIRVPMAAIDNAVSEYRAEREKAAA